MGRGLAPPRAIHLRSYLGDIFDFILGTIPEKHDLNPFLPLLKRNATLTVVGVLEPLAPVNSQSVAFHRLSVGGSLIGSIAETQEVLEFCAEHQMGAGYRGDRYYGSERCVAEGGEG